MIYYNVIKRKSPKDGTVKFYASAQKRYIHEPGAGGNKHKPRVYRNSP